MTYQDLIQFAQLAQGWLNSKPADTKLVYAVNKVLKKAKPILESYNEQVQDFEIQYATEKDGVLVREANGQLAYSKADLQKRTAAIRALAKSVVVIEPHVVPTIPPDLPPGLVDAFTGFVFAEPAEHAVDV